MNVWTDSVALNEFSNESLEGTELVRASCLPACWTVPAACMARTLRGSKKVQNVLIVPETIAI